VKSLQEISLLLQLCCEKEMVEPRDRFAKTKGRLVK